MDKARREHLARDLETWRHRQGDWFTIKLFDLISKADTVNLEHIRAGFPDEVEVFQEVMR